MQLSTEDNQRLDAYLRGGLQPVRTVAAGFNLALVRAREIIPASGSECGGSGQHLCAVRKRYKESDLQRALYDKPRPGTDPLLNPSQPQQVIAMVCGAPPPGRARWTIRLIAVEAVKRELVPQRPQISNLND